MLIFLMWPCAHVHVCSSLGRQVPDRPSVGLMKYITYHYSDDIMNEMASQVPGVSIVCPTVCWSTNQRKRQSSASLVFVRGSHRWPVDSPHKGPVTRKKFPFDDHALQRSHILPYQITDILTVCSTDFQAKNKEIPKCHVTGICESNLPHKAMRKTLAYHDVIMAMSTTQKPTTLVNMIQCQVLHLKPTSNFYSLGMLIYMTDKYPNSVTAL